MSRIDSNHVVLINPNLMKPPVAPIALDYLEGALRQEGYTISLIDLCFAPSWRDELRAGMVDRDPVAIGITIRNTDDCLYLSKDFILPRIREMVEYIRELSPRPIIAGGVGFSVMPEGVLSYVGVDLGICGDGEWTLPLVLAKMRRGDDVRDIPGVVHRTNGRVQRNAPVFRTLDRLPLPARGLVDNHRYFREGAMGGVETKRGCGRECIYCADPLAKGKRVRVRPPSTGAEEMETLLAQGIDHVHLCDSEFNVPYDHAVDVCRAIMARGRGEKMSWYAYLAPVPFTEELAGLMVGAGCKGIDFGVDHGDDLMLRRLGRHFTTVDLRRTASICRRFRIPFMYDLLLGGPGETRDSLARTIELMKEINPSRVGISAGVRVYPGTPLAQMIGRKRGNVGNTEGEDPWELLAPEFFVSEHLGDEMIPLIDALVGGDDRFFFGGGETDANYNYNDNSVLMEAIRDGYRGAFWDILRRLAEDKAAP